MKFFERKSSYNSYSIILLAVFLTSFFLQYTGLVTEYEIAPFLISYNITGVMDRGLIGTLMNLLFPTRIGTKEVVFVTGANVFFMNLLVFFLINKFIRKIQKNEASKTFINQTLLFILVYYLSPFSFTAYFTDAFSGRLEVFSINLLLLTFLFQNIDFRKKYIFAFFVSIFGILIHSNFIFLGLPYIFLFFAVDFSEGSPKRKFSLLLLVFIVVCTNLFVQFGLSSRVDYNFLLDYLHTPKFLELYNHISESKLEQTIYEMYYLSFFNGSMLSLERYWPQLLLFLPLFIIAVFPFIYMGINIFKFMLKQLPSRLKPVCRIILIGECLFLPLYIVGIDWGRWIVCQLLYTIISIGYLGYLSPKTFQKMLEFCLKIIRLHWKITIFITVVYIMLPKIGIFTWSIPILEQISDRVLPMLIE